MLVYLLLSWSQNVHRKSACFCYSVALMTCSVGCQTVAVVVSPDKMRSVTSYHSLTLLLLLLLPCLAKELARHRAQGAVTRVSYSDHGQLNFLGR